MTGPDEKPEPAPLSFKLMIVAAAVYLGWRLVQVVIRIVDWLSG